MLSGNRKKSDQLLNGQTLHYNLKMLSNVHLAPSDDEDLYSGFGTEEVAPALQTEDLEFDEGFQVKLNPINQ